MEIAPLQHKGRPNLSFSPTWWLQHGKEVCLYLRPAVTLAQHSGLSYTGSMSVWQGQLTSLQLASNVLQENARKMFPLSLPAHPLFMLQPWNVACGLCGCFHHPTWLASGFLPEPRERWSPHTAAEVPSEGTGQAAWVGTWDPLQVLCLASVIQIFSLCPCWELNHFSARKQASQCAPHSVLSYCWTGQISAWFSFKSSLQREGREGSHLY